MTRRRQRDRQAGAQHRHRGTWRLQDDSEQGQRGHEQGEKAGGVGVGAVAVRPEPCGTVRPVENPQEGYPNHGESQIEAVERNPGQERVEQDRARHLAVAEDHQGPGRVIDRVHVEALRPAAIAAGDHPGATRLDQRSDGRGAVALLVEVLVETPRGVRVHHNAAVGFYDREAEAGRQHRGEQRRQLGDDRPNPDEVALRALYRHGNHREQLASVAREPQMDRYTSDARVGNRRLAQASRLRVPIVTRFLDLHG